MSTSSAKTFDDNTAGVAAVVLVFSNASIDNFVLKIVDPETLISTITVLPTGAVLTLARGISNNVNPKGKRK